MPSKRKIINDPVFGFINIPNDFIYDLIQHPYLQRLNRIKQLGLAPYVYPGAQHTRFHHSLGAMHLMDEALINLRQKGNAINNTEYNGSLAAILMHDLGHGPFSHALEHTIVNNISHEDISHIMMKRINEEKDGLLDTAISIFEGNYQKKFLHQLVSGQLDVDRLDYLRRDSFFTGVIEGNIGSERIIKMMDVRNDQLVVESKGIYSIENFLMSRRLMYWQVYLHKTVIAAEKMLINTLRRAKYLSMNGDNLFSPPSLTYFLKNDIQISHFENEEAVNHFINLDDNDIWTSLKVWCVHPDKVFSMLSRGLIHRHLFKIKLSTSLPTKDTYQEYIDLFRKMYHLSENEAEYLISTDKVETNMYTLDDESIDILYSDNRIEDISTASDMFNIELLAKKVEKYYFAYFNYNL